MVIIFFSLKREAKIKWSWKAHDYNVVWFFIEKWMEQVNNTKFWRDEKTYLFLTFVSVSLVLESGTSPKGFARNFGTSTYSNRLVVPSNFRKVSRMEETNAFVSPWWFESYPKLIFEMTSKVSLSVLFLTVTLTPFEFPSITAPFLQQEKQKHIYGLAFVLILKKKTVLFSDLKI